MKTYWHKHGEWANTCSLARCESRENEQEARAAGYERLTQAEMRRHVRWVNGEMWQGQRKISTATIEHGTGARWVFVSQGMGDITATGMTEEESRYGK